MKKKNYRLSYTTLNSKKVSVRWHNTISDALVCAERILTVAMKADGSKMSYWAIRNKNLDLVQEGYKNAE